VEFFDPTVATLRGGGSATLLSAGTAAIAASMGGQKASTVLTVTVAVSLTKEEPADTTYAVGPRSRSAQARAGVRRSAANGHAGERSLSSYERGRRIDDGSRGGGDWA